jgi:TPR repeat protein
MNKSFVFVGLCIRLALVLSMAPVLETARAGPLEDGEEAYRLGNYASAMKFFRKAADRGDPKAQTYIGVLCFQGQSVSRNFIEAEKWFRKAALQGNSAAQTNLGLIFYHGLGRVKDYAENWAGAGTCPQSFS